jgi:hypothetical protein
MLRVSLLQWSFMTMEAAPLAATALFGGWKPGVHRWMLAWVGVQCAEEAAEVTFGLLGRHNLWLGYLFEPAAAAILLWTLSLWQTGTLARLTYRLAIPVTLLVYVLFTLALDNTSTFSRVAQPMLYIVGLGASAWTLVARSHAAAGDLLRQDWFWVCGGLVLFFGTFSSLGPVSRLLIANDPAMLGNLYTFSLGLMAVGFVAIAFGLTRPAS